jgi:hypothetical protein
VRACNRSQPMRARAIWEWLSLRALCDLPARYFLGWWFLHGSK